MDDLQAWPNACVLPHWVINAVCRTAGRTSLLCVWILWAREIASSAKEVFIIVRHSRRAFVEKVDFSTSIGLGDGGDHRKRLNLPGAGPRHVVTDLCIFAPDPITCELVVTHSQQGVAREQVQAATGWEVKFAEDVRTIAPATQEELTTLRALQTRTQSAHGIITNEYGTACSRLLFVMQSAHS